MSVLAAAPMPETLRGAALLGIVLALGGLGVSILVFVAWSRRRRASRSARGGGDGGRGPDPWRESGRRMRVDPEDGGHWPPIDPRGDSA